MAEDEITLITVDGVLFGLTPREQAIIKHTVKLAKEEMIQHLHAEWHKNQAAPSYKNGEPYNAGRKR